MVGVPAGVGVCVIVAVDVAVGELVAVGGNGVSVLVDVAEGAVVGV